MTIFLDNEQVKSLISYDAAVAAVEHGFRLDADGRVGPPERVDVPTESGWLRLMAVSAEGLGLYGFKAMNLTHERGVRYVLFVYGLDDGGLRAILDCQAITATRTAAATAVATKYLASSEVERIAIVGTGAEARSQLFAMLAVRQPREITVFSRSEVNRAAFVAAVEPDVDVPVRACSTLEEAVEGAQIITAATKSSKPVLHRRHITDGVHVNSIGASRIDQQELDPSVFSVVETVICDTVEHVAEQAGDVKSALETSSLSSDRMRSLGDVVTGRAPGRSRPDEVTLYKSVGSALQDLALAAVVLERAKETRFGLQVGDFPYLKPFR